MKQIVLATVIVALAGCSSLVSVTNPSTYQEVESIKRSYKEETGKTLPEPEGGRLCMDYVCYAQAWQRSFDENIKSYRNKQSQIAEIKRAEELAEQEKACRANPDCMKDREINEHKNIAYQAYNYFTGRYAMNRDEFDYRSRQMCDSAIAAQRNGASMDQLIGMIANSPGGDNADRMFGMELAKSCWHLGSLGITSSKDALPPREY